ncbi:MAG: hypothetical protein JXR77_12045 [Lentisphaeria bacterium]|nr:hypothetical protein [Lentisphaeria bacterium]
MPKGSNTYSLVTGDSRICFDADGCLLELSGRGRTWHGRPGPFWQMVVQAPSTPSVLGNHRPATPLGPPAIQSSASRLVLRYGGLRVEGGPLEVGVEATITAADGEFAFTFAVANRSRTWTVREIRAPLVTVPLATADRPVLLWPAGAGERFADPGRAGVMSAPYPTRLFVPWMALDGGQAGLYLASHDASLRTVTLNADACRVPGAMVLSVGVFPFGGPGENAVTAPILLRPYAGTWHEAARRYRHWADTWYRPIPRPSWVRETGGWQLVILKQQNGEIHWPYTDIGALVELGKENGLNVLGLFGWTEGGHDRRYPIYEPEPAMGGEEALRAGIAKAHAAGQKVILYTNGQLRDILTEWHAAHGQTSAALSERGDPFGESWQKYRDAPPRRMTYGCQSSRLWADTLLALARRVEALGADGILFDQLGSCHPMFCFSTEHDHANPALATGPGVAANLARIQQEMHAVNPDFVLLVEHVTDGVNQHIDLTHGCGTGFAPGGQGFPEMLRFTFPEILATQRHPTPAMDRNTANWACLYGFAHEVEYRYWPDRLYIEKGTVPEFSDYERIGAPPDIALMRRLDPREAAAYLRQVVDFEGRNADILRDGMFRDTLGFETDNPAVRSKAFARGDLLGILLWNPTPEPQAVTVTVTGGTLLEADAPETGTVHAAEPVPPQSLRLLRYRRDRNGIAETVSVERRAVLPGMDPPLRRGPARFVRPCASPDGPAAPGQRYAPRTPETGTMKTSKGSDDCRSRFEEETR